MKYSSARNGTSRRRTAAMVRAWTDGAFTPPIMTDVSRAASLRMLRLRRGCCGFAEGATASPRVLPLRRGCCGFGERARILPRMRTRIFAASVAFCAAVTVQGQAPRSLEVDWIDGEGGAATLLLTLAGEA